MDSASNMYDNTLIKGAGVGGSELPGGMSVTLSCCKSELDPDDDIIPLDYAGICNAAMGGRSTYVMSAVLAVVVSMMAYVISAAV
jgi:hypothetical protein